MSPGRRLGRVRALAVDISPLRESPPYRALWIGQIISQIGTQMVYVAVPWQVWQLTRSTALVGLVGLAEVVPIVLFSLIGGVAADSVDRRGLSVRMQTGMLACSTALAALAFSTPRPPLWAVYALVAGASAFGAVDRPARSAMLPRLVAREHMASAMALRQVVFQTTQIVGPAAGGLLIAAFDVGWVYAFDALTFVAALVSLRWVPSVLPEGGAERAGWAALKEGVGFSFRSPLILSIFLVDLGAMIFGMPRAVFPALAEGVFRMGASGVGLLYAAPSVGALGAARRAARKSQRRQSHGGHRGPAPRRPRGRPCRHAARGARLGRPRGAGLPGYYLRSGSLLSLVALSDGAAGVTSFHVEARGRR